MKKIGKRGEFSISSFERRLFGNKKEKKKLSSSKKKYKKTKRKTIKKKKTTKKKSKTPNKKKPDLILKNAPKPKWPRSLKKTSKKQKEKNGRMIKNHKKLDFIKTGISGFDKLFKRGIPEGSSVLVEGGPGAGKTIFCLSLVKEMCKKGKKVLYMSFEEPEYRLEYHLRSFGVDIESLKKKGLLYIKRFSALDIARSVEALLSEAKKELLIDVQPVLIPKDFDPDVVLIDSLTSIGSAFSGEESRFRIYMEQLFRYLESHEINSFLIRETANPTHTGHTFVEKGEAVSFLSDGIIVLYNIFYRNGMRKRGLEVLKMRGTEIDRKIVEFDIKGKKGIVVYPNKLVKGKDFVLT